MLIRKLDKIKVKVGIDLLKYTDQGRTVGGSMGAVDPPLSKKVSFLKKKSNNIILCISSLRTSHVYTCLKFTYSALSQRRYKIVAKSNCGIKGC